jgi:voltage-gated potassium channel
MTFDKQKSRLRFYLILLAVTLCLGTFGFMLAEGRSLTDALYFTVVTIATVGYGDIVPATASGKALAMLLIVLGVGTCLGVVANSTEVFLSRREEKSRRQKMHMLMGLFYSEIGNELLRVFARSDQQIQRLSDVSMAGDDWREREFRDLEQRFRVYPFKVEGDRLDLEDLNVYLGQHGEILIRLLENP